MVLQVRNRFEFKDFEGINDYLASLLQRMSGRINGFIGRAVRNPSDRDDVRQEACKKIFEDAEKFLECTSEDHMINLIMRIVRFACINHHRNNGRGIKVVHSIKLLETILVPEQDIDQEAAVEAVCKAMQLLHPYDRVVLRLRYFERLKRSEMAQVLDVSESRVKNLLRRALGRLRTLLATFW